VHIIAVLLLLKALLVTVMYVWFLTGTPPLPLFNPALPQSVNALYFVQELGTIAFLFIILGVLRVMMEHQGQHKGMMAAARSLKPARRTRRRSKK